MPEIHPDTSSILAKLDPKRTFLLDIGYKEYRKEYAGVFENFEKDIYTILVSNQKLVSKYKRLILVIPEGIQTKELASGFNKFSKKTTIATAIKNNIDADDVKKGAAFIVLDDKHLVALIKQIKTNNWQLGKDIGILSYNETLLKSVVGEGITTITTDLGAMGKSMAEMVLTGKRAAIENSFVMIDRQSF